MEFTTRTINIVLVGESLPVDVVDIDDFAVPGYHLREELRAPVALQARGGPFSLHILPERFQIAVNLHDRPTKDTDVNALAECAKVYLEYVGKRSVRAVGHNIRASVPVEPGHKSDIFKKFVDYDAIMQYTSDQNPLVDLRLTYRLGTEDRVTQEIEGHESPDQFNLSFNFHFQLINGRTVDPVAPLTAIEQLSESVRLAREKIEAFANLAVQDREAER